MSPPAPQLSNTAHGLAEPLLSSGSSTSKSSSSAVVAIARTLEVLIFVALKREVGSERVRPLNRERERSMMLNKWANKKIEMKTNRVNSKRWIEGFEKIGELSYQY
jgi:hypothetical protein